MANTKTINGTGQGHWTWKLEVEETNVDTTLNRSTVRVKGFVGRDSSGGYPYGGNCSWTSTVNGSTKSDSGYRSSNGNMSNIGAWGWSTEAIFNYTWDIDHDPDGTKTVNISGGITSAAFSPNSTSASGTFTLTPIDRAPVVSDLTITNVGRTGATASFEVTDQGATTVSASSIKLSLTSGSYDSPVQTLTGDSTGVSGTFSGLTPNTKYYVRGEATNTIGTTPTTETDFTTTGNNPTISSITSSPSKNYATLTGNVSYDTNASFSSVEVQWGTSTSYGNTSSAWRIPESGSTLAQNTTYYYRARVTDNWNRTSSWKTGSFTTSGDNPVVTNVVADPDLQYCQFTISTTYATNASYRDMTIQYGKTSSYGSTADTYSEGWAILSPLDSKQTYYYRVRVKDNYDRWSSWVTGTFTTTASAPWDVTFITQNLQENSVDIGFSFSCGAPDWPTSGTITVTGNGYNQTRNLTWTGNPPDYELVTFTGLTANTTYTITGSMTNSTGTTNATTKTFTTPCVLPTINSVTVRTLGSNTITFDVNASGGTGDTLYYRYAIHGSGDFITETTNSGAAIGSVAYGQPAYPEIIVRNGERFVYMRFEVTPIQGQNCIGNIIFRQDGWWKSNKVYVPKYTEWLNKQ